MTSRLASNLRKEGRKGEGGREREKGRGRKGGRKGGRETERAVINYIESDQSLP